MVSLSTEPAICYSGYRPGQSPAAGAYPSRTEIAEDLRLLAPCFRVLRLYDCSPHAERVLEVIRAARLPFTVMLGAWLAAEVSNSDCPWGGIHDDDTLAANRRENDAELERLIELARAYEDVVTAVAVGNEATVSWTDHRVPVERVRALIRRARAAVVQPVTVCENHVPWTGALAELAAELDFISLHSYPVWEQAGIEAALRHTEADYERIARAHPDRPVAITEAGWTTRANGRGIIPDHASEALQSRYCRELAVWARERGVATFLFEAFDEPWKGSSDPLEPEKHWGLYTADRRPKPAFEELRAVYAGRGDVRIEA